MWKDLISEWEHLQARGDADVSDEMKVLEIMDKCSALETVAKVRGRMMQESW